MENFGSHIRFLFRKVSGMMARWVPIVLLVALVVPSTGFALTTSQASPDVTVGEILVKFKPGTPRYTIDDVHRQNHGQVKEVIQGINVLVIDVPAGQEAAAVSAYARNSHVLFAELNQVSQATSAWVPNDPKVDDQWQYHNIGQTGGAADADIDAFKT